MINCSVLLHGATVYFQIAMSNTFIAPQTISLAQKCSPQNLIYRVRVYGDDHQIFLKQMQSPIYIPELRLPYAAKPAIFIITIDSDGGLLATGIVRRLPTEEPNLYCVCNFFHNLKDNETKFNE
jgi:hypothetical protein